MKVSKQALQRVLSDRRIILSIALQLGFSEQWTRRLLSQNKDNGPLTTVSALAVIREETGLTDSEILEVMEPQS